MASLRETRDRINSVRSTLKITSAMKLVASAKLRKAQKAIEALRPYERALAEILSAVGPVRSGVLATVSTGPTAPPTHASPSDRHSPAPSGESPTVIVAIASNSSLCGGFNGNVIRKALETIQGCEGEVELYPVGRKMADGLRRAGYTAPAEWNDLIGHPAYDKSTALARSLSERFLAGEISRVVLVYTRFKSAASQEPVAEEWLPFVEIPGDPSCHSERAQRVEESPTDYILEPDAEALVAQLLPQVMMLKFHAAILDSAAAEQAARTIAMQTATDNAEDLLGELTLEYNKGRQQKITAEILDLLGGSAQ